MKNSSERKWEHWEDLPEDVENELIEKIANYSVNNNLGLLTSLLLESGGRLTSFFATLGMGLFGPFLEILGLDTYTALFRKENNRIKLMDRLDKLELEKKKKGT